MIEELQRQNTTHKASNKSKLYDPGGVYSPVFVCALISRCDIPLHSTPSLVAAQTAELRTTAQAPSMRIEVIAVRTRVNAIAVCAIIFWKHSI